ncbi:MAG: helix-turn-helix transcriptional regulator [Acidobacteriota bacterium]|nr:helix-turn-helix transcriptional regulator [Acidobacteriota bacterium]
MRQASLLRDFDPKRGISVTTLAYEYPAEFQVPEHAHGADQLIYAICGVMEVVSGSNMWLVPPSFAIWIPAETTHRIHMPRPVSMRTLYFRPGSVRMTPLASAVLHVTPLLRELILEAVRIGELRARHNHERALRDLLVLHLEAASSVPTFVVLPTDERALALARAVLSAPEQTATLAALCRDAGMSVRTVQRIFRKDIGIDFEVWRRQARLTKAVELLLAGHSVKEVSFCVGYRQPSAFVEGFRRSFGITPKAWVISLEERNREV